MEGCDTIAKSIRLTQRDLELLNDLYKVRYLNSNRIYELYGNYKSCMRRLKQLVNSGYLRIIDHTHTGENVYCITKKSCNTLYLPYVTITKTDKLNHFLATSDFYFSLKDRISNFKIESQYYFNHNNKKYTFRPDIVCELDNRNIFVEIDLSNRRFEKKVKTWEVLYDSGIWINWFQKYPPIVIVSTDVNKVKNIINKYKTIDLNYVYKDYNQIKNWKYKY